MILSSNRYPGQLMPVGARYWYNAGKPINALKSIQGLGNPDGLGGPIAVSGLGQSDTAGFMVFKALLVGGLGYYVGSNLARKDAKRFGGVVGALSAATLGVPGLALTTFLYAPRSK